jgi:hypothetical protein
MSLFAYGTALAQIQDALVQLSQDKPNDAFGADKNANIMASYYNIIGPMLMDLFPWQQFRKAFEVIGDGTTREYDLPTSISRFVDNTGWSYAKRRPVLVITAQTWAEIEVWLSKSFFVNPAVRIFNDKMYFMTPPADQEKIVFEYIDRNWVLDEDGLTFKERVEKNGDTPQFDYTAMVAALKTKWAETRGMDTTRYQNEFMERIQQLTQRNQIAAYQSLNSRWAAGRYLDGANVPDTGYGNF